MRPGKRQTLMLGALVVLVHAMLLPLLLPRPWDEPPVPGPALLQVHSIARAPAVVPVPAAAPPRKALRREVPSLAVPTPTVEAPAPLPVSTPAPPEPAASSAAGSGDIEVPVYATQLPPSFRRTFTMTRGAASGEVVLSWQREGDRYEARLQGGLAGTKGFESTSVGAIDSAGIAPLRFLDRRHGRGAHAANFQREPGKISYSGPANEFPLLPGSQDHLSWLVQLPAILAADPALAAAGRQVTLFVSGARGNADVWVFTVQAAEPIEGLHGVTGLKLLREPRRPYDTRAEVWLDPTRHYLPVRLRQTNGDFVTEWLLRADDSTAGP